MEVNVSHYKDIDGFFLDERAKNVVVVKKNLTLLLVAGLDLRLTNALINVLNGRN